MVNCYYNYSILFQNNKLKVTYKEKKMDWEIRKIEKYYLEKKDPKNLYKNVEDMTPQELREIVFSFIYNISIL